MLRNYSTLGGCLILTLALIACDSDTGSSSGGPSVGNGDGTGSGDIGSVDGGNGGGGDNGDGLCSHPDNVLSNPSGGTHGAECTDDSDCQYGLCVTSPLVSGGAFSFCTKQCNCGANSSCKDDTGSGGQLGECLRFGLSSYPDEPDTAYCQQTCSSLADCQDLSDKYTACKIVVGTRKVCAVD